MARTLLSSALTVCFLGWAGFYLLTTLCAIINFSFRQPMFDQWRMYEYFLGLPFPDNVLQLENGHRPIIPNLFRVAEIHWFAANQLVQITVGTACAFLTWLAFATTAWRQRDLPPVARSIGVLLATLGIFWLANARMLLHGNESLHVYLLTLCVAIAALCTYQAYERHSLAWYAAASAACVVAMFCFGPGAASFPAIMLLAVALRLPVRWLLLPAGILTTCLLLYLYLLPGNNGVRQMMSLHPIDSTLYALRWISSPLAIAWLGHATPPLDNSTTGAMPYARFGAAIVASANWVQSFSGLTWRTLATALAALGVATFGIRFALLLRTKRITRLQAFACVFCLFALATAAIIGIGRLAYLQEYPDQVYADRYLVWPCLFWAGLALLLLADLARLNKAAAFALLAACALPIVALPMQKVSAGWGSIVHRTSQRIAAAARSSVFDAEIFPDGADASKANVLYSLEHFRQQHLAMFADNIWERLGTHCSVESNATVEAQVKISSAFVDTQSGLPVARIEGRVLNDMAHISRSDQLAVLDDTDTIVGFAEFGFLPDDASSLHMGFPRKRGFDGYIRGYDSKLHYRLVQLQRDGLVALTMRTIPADFDAERGTSH